MQMPSTAPGATTLLARRRVPKLCAAVWGGADPQLPGSQHPRLCPEETPKDFTIPKVPCQKFLGREGGSRVG